MTLATGAFGAVPFGVSVFGGGAEDGPVVVITPPPPPPPPPPTGSGTASAYLTINGTQPTTQSGVIVNILNVSYATGPVFTLTYTSTNSQGLPQQQLRFELILTSTRAVLLDTGWIVNMLASGTTGSFSINLATINPPLSLNTSGAAYTILLYSSPSLVDPAVSHWYGMGTYSGFDIVWGTPTLSWGTTPASIIQVAAGTQATVPISWLFTDSGGYTQGFWEVIVSSPDGNEVYYDTGLQSGAVNSFTIPGINANTSYLVTVSALSTNGIAALPLTAVFSTGAPEPLTPVTGGFLQRYLALIGYELDTNRSMLEALRNVNNPLLCPGNLLPALSQELGVSYEDAMGMNQTRKLLSTIVHQYKTKGTLPGIAGISTAVTGWATLVTEGANLLLSSIVPFYLSTTTAAGVTYTSTAPYVTAQFAADPNTTAMPLANYPTIWPPALATTTQNLTATMYTGPSNAVVTSWSVMPPLAGGALAATVNGVAQGVGSVSGYGIPIEGLTTVAFSLYFWTSGFGAAFSVAPSIQWYNSGQVLLSTWSGGAIALTQNAWTLVSGAAIVPPAGAVWAVLILTPTTSVSFVLDTATAVISGAYFGAAAYSAYREPRTLSIELLADRVNYIANPSFEGNEVGTGPPLTAGGTVAYWTALTNCTIAPSQTYFYTTPGVPNPGTWSMKVTASGNGTMAVLSSKMAINPEFLFTASYWGLTPVSFRNVTMSILFYDAAGTLLVSFPGAVTQAEQLSQWVHIYAQVSPGEVIPLNATQAAVEISWAAVVTGEAHYVDAVMLEPVWALRPYFDASLYAGTFPYPNQASDYLWAGSASATVSTGSATIEIGPSYYYANYLKKLARLSSVLAGSGSAAAGLVSPLSITGFLPVGAAYTLVTPASV